MSIDQVILPVMVVGAVMGSIMLLAHLTAAFLYDVRTTKRQRHVRLHPYAKPYRSRPLVTVVISAHNNADTIMGTLDSVVHSSYHKLELLVIDHASEDMTRQAVKGYIEMHPNQTIRLVASRQRASELAAVRAARRYGKGELVLRLAAGSAIHKDAIKNAVYHFAHRQGLDILCINKQVTSQASVAGLLERYSALLARRTDKFLSSTGLLVIVGDVAAYTRSAYVSTRDRRQLRAQYANDVMVTAPAFASYPKLFGYIFRRHMTLLRGIGKHRLSWVSAGYMLCSMVLSIAAPFLVGYFLYIALYLHEPTLLLLVIVGLSAFLIVAIGEERSLSSWQKALYVLAIPVTYVLFYFLSLARLIAALGAPLNRRVLTIRR